MGQRKTVKVFYNKTLFAACMFMITLFACLFLWLLSFATNGFTERLIGRDIAFFSILGALMLIVAFTMLYTGCNAHMIFTLDGIEFRQAFRKTEFHSYREYAYVEKAFYMYYGMPMYYMVLGNRRLRNEEVCQINNVRPSSMLIKIRYNKKNYEAVLSIVPSRIALSLQAQFKDIPAKRFNFCI